MKLQTIIRTTCMLLFVLLVNTGTRVVPTVFAAGEPVVVSGNTEQLMPTSALLMGEVTDEGAAPVIGVWAEYSTDTSYGSNTQRYNLNELTLPGTFDVSITGLTCNTTYHYRFKIRNNAMLDGYSSDATFTTSECYSDTIVSHWTLNEASGTRADSVGSNNLTPTNSPLAKTGQVNDAVEATSADASYLSVPDNASLSTGGETSFTVSLWVKLNAKTGTQVFVSKYGTGGEYAIYYENTFDRLVFSTYSSENNYFVKADQLGSPQIGTWYHIIATHNADTNTNSILINDGIADTLTAVPEHLDSDAPFVIGAFGVGAAFPADAVIDDVRFAKSAYSLPTPLPLFAGGDGTMGDPYQVSTCQQLQDINQHLDAHYVLINDIDCSATSAWNGNTAEWADGDIGGTLIPDAYTAVTNNGYAGFNPIGRDNTEASGFTGTFDGQDHTISNLWIFRKADPYVGLFGYATGATIQNVTLTGARVVGSEHTGGFIGYGTGVTLSHLANNSGMVRAYLSYRGGGIAGSLENESTLDYAVVSEGTVHGSGNVIGGLVGELNGSSVTDSNSSAAIDGGEHIGGAFGNVSTSTMQRISVTGSVVSNSNENDYVFIVKSGDYTGGFAGYVSNSIIESSSASGIVTAEGDVAGGFIGFMTDTTVTDSYATGSVSASTVVGGFAGYINSSTLNNVYATGNVTTDTDYSGGFAGFAVCGTSITHAYANGSVTAGGSYAGGFTGIDGCEGLGAIYNQVAAHGNVTITGSYAGGFVGQSLTSIFDNVYASGNVVAADRIGAFAGEMRYDNMTHVYARGTVTPGVMAEYIGSFTGEADSTVVTNSFVDQDKAAQSVMCGIGECSEVYPLTTAQAKTRVIYTDAGWDFDTIWTSGTYNDGYPYFQWESFEDGEPELLSLSATDITKRSAVMRGQIISGSFGPGSLGFALSEEPFEVGEGSPALIGPADDFGTVNEETGVYTLDLNTFMTPDNYLGLTGLTCNTTYYYLAIGYIGFGEGGLVAANNTLSFTTLPCNDVEPTPTPPVTVTSTGGGSQFAWKPSSKTNTSSTPESTCSADQILTQNLKAGAQNGKYHPFTKAVVKEVKILQGHMNRLGFKSGPVDGILGKITDGAIKRMQTFLGTKADGLIGPMTRALINTSCGSKGLQKS